MSADAVIATPKKPREIDRHDERVARAGDEARHARAEAERRGWTEQERRQRADAHAREQGDRRRAARRARRSEHEPIDARVEIAERTQALPQFVDARVVARWRGHVGQILRAATNADSSRSRSARRPNGASARSAVWHSSAASWRAPATPLNDTNVVLRASSRTALPVSAGSPSTSSRSSMIWNASPRFFAYAASAATDSASAPARQRAGDGGRAEERAGLAAMNALEQLEADLLLGRQQVGGLAADQPVRADGIGEERRQTRRERRVVVARERAVGEVEQAERREDRDRLAERQVIRRPAAPERRIVHRREIVEDERRGVDELHRGGGRRAPASRCRRTVRAESSVSTGRTRFDGANSV